jgi:type I restriction enzyme S subunit
LSNCISYLSRGVAPKYINKSNVYALNQRAIRWWNIDEASLKFHDPEKTIRNEAYIRKGDVVINSTGDGTIGRAYWFFHEAHNLFADSHVSIARTLPDVLLPELVVFYMETSIYQDIVYGHVTGSTGQLELNRSNLGKIPFLCPSIQIQEIFSSRIAPLFALVYSNQQELNTLIALRDTLLPKLLSGEIRVNDAEKAVEAMV